MQFLYSPDQLTPRLKYSLDFIFSTLGFNLDFVTKKNLKKDQGIILSYIPNSEIEEFNQLNMINIYNSGQLNRLEEFEQQKNTIIINNESVPILGSKSLNPDTGWRKHSGQHYFYKSNGNIWQLNFDLIANVFYHLSRFEERWRIFPEEKELDWNKSVLADAEQLQIPVVDVLIHFLKSLIFSKSKNSDLPVARVLPWQNGEKFAVAFTHDVDLTRGYSAKEYLISKGKSLIYSILDKTEEKKNQDQLLQQKEQTVWTFPAILKFYKKMKWKGTFFFLAKIVEGRHIRYNIGSAKFQQLFKDLKKNKHEIALHPSLKAFDHPEKYKSEKENLNHNASSKIKGMRQHYLRYKLPRLWKLAHIAKLKFDSSVAYNFKAGFRAGTSHAFKTFDYSSDRNFDVVEIPITFFEYNLPSKGQDINESCRTITNLITQVQKNEGILNVLLHPSNYLQEPYNKYWDLVVNTVKKKNIAVMTLSEIYDWYNNKNKVKIDLSKNKSEIIVKINKPAKIKSLTIELSEKGKFKQSDGIEIEQLTNHQFCIFCTKNKFSLKYSIK